MRCSFSTGRSAVRNLACLVAGLVLAPLAAAQPLTGWYDHIEYNREGDHYGTDRSQNLVDGKSHGDFLAPYDNRLDHWSWQWRTYLEAIAANDQKVYLHIPRHYIPDKNSLSEGDRTKIRLFVKHANGLPGVRGYIVWDEPRVGEKRSVGVLEDVYDVIKYNSSKPALLTMTLGTFQNGGVNDYKNACDRWIFDRYPLTENGSEFENLGSFLASHLAADKYAREKGLQAHVALQAYSAELFSNGNLRTPTFKEFRYMLWASKCAYPWQDRFLYAHHFAKPAVVNLVEDAMDTMKMYDIYNRRVASFYPRVTPSSLSGDAAAAYARADGIKGIKVETVADDAGDGNVYVTMLKHKSQNKYLVIGIKRAFDNQEVRIKFRWDNFGQGKKARRIDLSRNGNGSLGPAIDLIQEGNSGQYFLPDNRFNNSKKHNFGDYEVRAWIVQ